MLLLNLGNTLAWRVPQALETNGLVQRVITKINRVEDKALNYANGALKIYKLINRWSLQKGHISDLGLNSKNLMELKRHECAGFWWGSFSELKSHKKLATVPLQVRNGKDVIKASFEKFEYNSDRTDYVLKYKNEQIGFLEVFQDEKGICIDYLTNCLGRDKYRNIEKILVRGMIEDFAQKGPLPKIRWCPMDLGTNMGKRFSNKSLYEKMGEIKEHETYISGEDALKIGTQMAEKWGEIISGSLLNKKM